MASLQKRNDWTLHGGAVEREGEEREVTSFQIHKHDDILFLMMSSLQGPYIILHLPDQAMDTASVTGKAVCAILIR